MISWGCAHGELKTEINGKESVVLSLTLKYCVVVTTDHEVSFK